MRRDLAVGLGIVLMATVAHGAGGFRAAEVAMLDVDYHVRAWLRPPGPPDDRLVIVAMDDQLGEWMTKNEIRTRWDVWADLLDRVADAKPKAVFLDVLFSQDDRDAKLAEIAERVRVTSGDALGEASRADLQALEENLGAGRRLRDAMRRAPLVLPISCPEGDHPGAARAEDEPLAAKLPAVRGTPAPTVRRQYHFGFPGNDFWDAAAEIAHSCEWTDADNVLRREPSVLQTTLGDRNLAVSSASVALARRTLGLPDDAIEVGASAVRLGDARTIPIDARGFSLIAWSRPGHGFMTRAQQGKPTFYGAVAVLQGKVPASRLAGKVVFIGATVARGSDSKQTPFGRLTGARTPGVEKIAIQTDAIVRGEPLPYRPAAADLFGFVLTALTGAIGVAAGIRFRPAIAGAALFGGALLLAGGGGLAFTLGPWIDTAFPIATLLVAGLIAGGFRYAEQEQRQRFLREAFAKYLDPAMVEKLMADRDRLRLFGEDKELTILFADVRGFTSRSEKSSPAEIVSVLNSHLTAMAKVIHAHHGTLDKFVGDCVMAFWGAPIDDPDHARHAVECALAMLATLDAQNAERKARGEPAVEMGVGLNTGRVIVGNMGSETRFDYTVIGDAVNTASRLESLTKEAKCRLLLGERTAELVAGTPLAPVEWGRWEVKGKTGKLPVFTPAAMAESEKAAQPPAAAGRTTPVSPS